MIGSRASVVLLVSTAIVAAASLAGAFDAWRHGGSLAPFRHVRDGLHKSPVELPHGNETTARRTGRSGWAFAMVVAGAGAGMLCVVAAIEGSGRWSILSVVLLMAVLGITATALHRGARHGLDKPPRAWPLVQDRHLLAVLASGLATSVLRARGALCAAAIADEPGPIR